MTFLLDVRSSDSSYSLAKWSQIFSEVCTLKEISRYLKKFQEIIMKYFVFVLVINIKKYIAQKRMQLYDFFFLLWPSLYRDIGFTHRVVMFETKQD